MELKLIFISQDEFTRLNANQNKILANQDVIFQNQKEILEDIKDQSNGIREILMTNNILTLYGKYLQVSISSTFYAHVFHTKVLFSSYVLAKRSLSNEKGAHKMLIKLTAEGNFTNILQTAFPYKSVFLYLLLRVEFFLAKKMLVKRW